MRVGRRVTLSVLSLILQPLEVLTYQRGDVVSTLARTQYAGWRTAWTEVLRNEMPRFRVDSPPLILKLPAPHEGIAPGEAFKLSLAYSDNKFVVPWALVSDGRGRSLSSLVVTFLYSGSDIVQVKWNGDYTLSGDNGKGGGRATADSQSRNEKKSNAKRGSVKADDGIHGKNSGGDDGVGEDDADEVHSGESLPTELKLRYEWYEVVEHDVESGLVVMFAVSMAAALAVLCITCGRDEFNVESSGSGHSSGTRQSGSSSRQNSRKTSARKLR